jgi:calcineurin-like phosphoesterase family protein
MPRLVRAVLFASVIVAAGWLSATPVRATAPAAKRLVAIADIHGDLDAFVAILKRAELIDDSQKWSGGSATLVQVGDMIDRGPKSRAVLDFVMALQKDARRTDGRVVVLLGNHEVLNMFGDLRYVMPSDYASYAGPDAEKRRTEAYDDYVRLAGASAKSRDEWMAAHPAGFVEQREAFGPEGTYGKWLRSLPAVAKVDDSLFLHGGVSESYASWSVSRLNDRVATEIKAFDDARAFLVSKKMLVRYPTLEETLAAVGTAVGRKVEEVNALTSFANWLTIHENGPLWFRGYARLPDADAEALAGKVTQAMGVTRLVMGHTTEPGSIVQRFGDKVYLIDTGMLRGYVDGGQASALEIADGHVRAIYPDSTKTLK